MKETRIRLLLTKPQTVIASVFLDFNWKNCTIACSKGHFCTVFLKIKIRCLVKSLFETRSYIMIWLQSMIVDMAAALWSVDIM